ncbi:protein of unknown function DUF488 [Desulfovibrio sp. X2]|uniref:DUF488 domain-containing protein n=1 Tax=Desulfovibrio sp. X2 TaxID=941449 RepID=UPI0003588B26|nr:DUF488 family protein [Desulfovibrio sp. X2]EPR36347.1 protein of unknown function DUF488 [Desulfovibrio sp. X2]
MLRIKRAYEEAGEGDGTRYLVDALWPRGVSRERLRIAAWLKAVAPGAGLRKRFHHEKERWPEFREAYLAELGQAEGEAAEALGELRRAMAEGDVTLVYAARDEKRNNAVVLREFLAGG